MIKKFHKYIILIFLLNLFYLYNLIPNKFKESFEEIENFIQFNLAGNLIHFPILYTRKCPEISIVISTFNGEFYLKPAVRSVQNQNFRNIEIIIVNDASIDNSEEVIKELMKEDRRIKLLSNYINRGTLYTKTRGVRENM